MNNLLLFLFPAVVLLIGAGIVMLVINDVVAGASPMRRCPRCGGKRSIVKQKSDELFSESLVWKCKRCGNERDEFGNPL
jgi:DNA-directed RNA polymerase subunit RPC12/RpoP